MLLDGIPLDRVSTSMTINSTASILLALYIAAARRRGIPETRSSGTVQNDILKEYVARGTYIYPPEPSLRLVTDVFAYCARRMCRAGTPSRSPATTSARRGRRRRRRSPSRSRTPSSTCAPRAQRGPRRRRVRRAHLLLLRLPLRLHRGGGEVPGRAAAVGAPGEGHASASTIRGRSTCASTCRRAGSTLTAQQPDNNVVRVALQALAAVLGGCQSLHTNGKDEALALPTEAAARLALRTQQVIAYESGVADTVDPLGGSYAVEAATDARSRPRRARILDRIESRGGAWPRSSAARSSARSRSPPIVTSASGVRRARDRGRERARRAEAQGAAHRDPAHRPRPGAGAGRTGCAPCARGGDAGRHGRRRWPALEDRARSGRERHARAVIDAVLACGDGRRDRGTPARRCSASTARRCVL